MDTAGSAAVAVEAEAEAGGSRLAACSAHVGEANRLDTKGRLEGFE